MEPFRGGLDHTREDKKPSDDKGNVSDADQLPVSPSLRRGNDRRWASPCPLYEPLFRLNYVALPPRPKPAAAAIQEGSYSVSGSRCLNRWILLARRCPRMVLADLPDPVVGGATTAELRATTIRLRMAPYACDSPLPRWTCPRGRRSYWSPGSAISPPSYSARATACAPSISGAAVWRPDRRFSADTETSGQLRLFYSTTMTRKTRHGAKG